MGLDKKDLRLEYKRRRTQLSAAELEKKSWDIFLNVNEFLDRYPGFEHIHLFFPIVKHFEVNTFPIKDQLEKQNAILYTSRVLDGSPEMEVLRLKPNTEFALDPWGIPIPVHYQKTTAEQIQLVFVPLLVFDKSGNRIGFGKGYYDRFLASLSPSVVKVGLSFFDPEQSIPADEHDVLLDFCITPGTIISFQEQS